MRAVVITEEGGPEVLAHREEADPQPSPSELVVRVEASALNRADLLQRRGGYPAPPGSPRAVPGLELAGTVEALGRDVTRWQLGDRVMAVVGGGACAERALVHERQAMRVPEGLDPVEAAAIPEAFSTAFDAAFLQAGLASGQWLAVPAVASGVGTAAIQLARALGARTAGSSRTPDKLQRVRPYGLDRAVEGPPEALAEDLREATPGAAVALDLVGGASTPALLRAMRPQGTVVLVGLMGGARAEMPLGRILAKRLELRGTVLRSRPIEEKIALARRFDDRVVPLFEGEAPALRPVVDERLSWSRVAEAHERLERNETVGKLVLVHD